MLAKISKLLGHPAFRADPLAVLGRGAALFAHVATKREPSLNLTKYGERLRLPADFRFTTMSTYLLRDWVEPELHELERFVRPGDTFVDIGANIGLFTLKAARIVGPQGRVIAAEPGAISANRLEANLQLNDWTHVEILREAVSDTEGTVGLHHIDLGGDPQAFSILSDNSGVSAETVQSTTLDRLSERFALTRVDCIKLDVEGAEPLIIAGGAHMLAQFRPMVIFEINSPPAMRAGTFTAAGEALVKLGYGLHQLHDSNLMTIATQPGEHGNLIAIHPEGAQPV